MSENLRFFATPSSTRRVSPKRRWRLAWLKQKTSSL